MMTNKHGRLALMLALGALLFALAPPSDGRESPQSRRTGPPILDRIVRINAQHLPFSSIKEQIEQQVDVNLTVVDTEAIEPMRFTMRLRGVRLGDVFDELTRTKGLYFRQRGGNYFQVERPEKVSLTYNNADIRAVIQQISTLSGQNVVIAPGVTGSITLNIRNVFWFDALEEVARTHDYVVVFDEDRNLTRVVTQQSLQRNLETRTFHLRYRQPPSIFMPRLESDYADGTLPTRTGANTEFPLYRSIQSVLSPDGTMEFDRGANAFIITDIPTKLNEITQIISEVDTPPYMVSVNVRFVTTQDEDVFRFGVDYNQTMPMKMFRPSYAATFPGGPPATYLDLDSWRGTVDTGDDEYSPPLMQFHREDVQADLSRPTWLDFGQFMTDLSNVGQNLLAAGGSATGVLSFREVDLFLRMVRARRDFQLIQSPEITTMDNEEATIFIGQKQAYPEIRVTYRGDVPVQEVVEAAKSPMESGFQLLIIPHVIPETEEVTLTLIPEAETGVLQSISTPAGTISLPSVSTKVLLTRLLLKSGETAVIGGWNEESNSETISRVPLLGDIPVLQYLFRSRYELHSKTRILILVTANIIRSHDVAAEMVRQSRNRRIELLRQEPLFQGRLEFRLPEAEGPTTPAESPRTPE